LAIQRTTGDNHSKRLAKVQEAVRQMPMLATHFKPEIWSWSERVVRLKSGAKAKRRRWTLRRERINHPLWTCMICGWSTNNAKESLSHKHERAKV
jgi:hypothetical protein